MGSKRRAFLRGGPIHRLESSANGYRETGGRGGCCQAQSGQGGSAAWRVWSRRATLSSFGGGLPESHRRSSGCRWRRPQECVPHMAAATDVKLREHPFRMATYGVNADAKSVGNFLVRPATGQEVGHVTLSGRQPEPPGQIEWCRQRPPPDHNDEHRCGRIGLSQDQRTAQAGVLAHSGPWSRVRPPHRDPSPRGQPRLGA
jgi:hypothetical protein